MKRLLLSLLIFSSFNALSQISLESTYNATSPYGGTFYYVKTSTLEKFAFVDEAGTSVKIYNTNHSLYKNIPIPSISFAAGSVLSDVYVSCISDDIFNIDSKIEFAVEYQSWNTAESKSGSFVYIYNEDGTVLFSRDSTYIGYVSESNIEKELIFKTSTGTKMVLQNATYNNQDILVYALPGNLTSANQPINIKPGLSYPFPNPSYETTRIAFELPQGVSEGEVLVYNTQGMPIKKYIVDNTFSDLVLNNSDLAPGTYYYQLKAGNNFSDAKKMMVIK